MKVSPDTVVRLAYRLYDSSGDLVDEVRAESPIEFVHGYAQVLPGLDGAIDGVAEGEGCVAQLLPELAFGERSEEAMLEIDRHDFPGGADVQVGDEVLVSGPGGIEVPMPIVALTEALMLVDLNHPLAGQSVRFEIDVLTVRAATDEQIDAVQAEMDEHIANERGIVYDSDFPGVEPAESLVQIRRRETPVTKDPS